ncbi:MULTISPECIES: NAD-dependent epimerase/dehydratase family protein [Pseudonocardia]|uniref:3 beta-hydroxysteroid dehydrogenase/Delta 5-->4-isomerase n=2 Tax=Pseudonocardia TaxID=1847 RepID=A0A1Y2N902_PSEAH|nr:MULTISPECIES: NAD(P)-dependent oxidoreductase [Pseudonocardia]OSY43952.1 3 beta-hydroxysteroid dehydrogenase/Delta 5-->4-isomerase [Pseudonocardia autotrophica]TDN74315.1 nucleoside-diphosphate-sugar epimerase [Pseudonocardia autotrophica]BBG05079.1 putative DTDP-glucose-4,6-dehydratase-related protein [Pseudonocardia autotrophica]GEC28224.1 putative DTDP-glucose-4,6-dehydratase-related protein [Pseudonocardia saturnea]
MERFLVTGSSGHLGEALVRTLRADGVPVTGLDRVPSPWTDVVAPLADRDALAAAMTGVTHVLHTATLHKPHVGSHTRQDFVDSNVSGTLAVLECAAAAGVTGVVFTSSTSAFGRALVGDGAVTWIDESVVPRVRNVYGATKTAAEELCELAAQDPGLPVVVLRTSRFFPEADDREEIRLRFDDAASKLVEFCHRRVDLADVVSAHLAAARRAPELGFARYVISAPTPFTRDDLPELGRDVPAVLARRAPEVAALLRERGWAVPEVDRVYSSARAVAELGWRPRWDAGAIAARLRSGAGPGSPLAAAVGAKGYHAEPTGVYTP